MSFDSNKDSNDNAIPLTNDTIFPSEASSFSLPASNFERSSN